MPIDMIQKTRLDTRPPVADGWVGADMCTSHYSHFSTRADGRTDRLTDQWTKGWTKSLIELRVPTKNVVCKGVYLYVVSCHNIY